MNHKELALQSDRPDVHRFHGKIGMGHIPTLLIALGLWWLILWVLPIGQ